MTAKHPYYYQCPTCGGKVTTDAKHHVRLRTSCLGCLRIASGWKHRPGCTGEAGHKGACPQ